MSSLGLLASRYVFVEDAVHRCSHTYDAMLIRPRIMRTYLINRRSAFRAVPAALAASETETVPAEHAAKRRLTVRECNAFASVLSVCIFTVSVGRMNGIYQSQNYTQLF